MMTRRMATAPAPEPPVRFYKTIAVSFLCLTIVMLGVVMYLTSKKAVITVTAKEDAKVVSLVVPVDARGLNPRAISGGVTTTAFSWSKKYYPTETKTLDAVAQGEVTIINKGNTDQTLVATTRLLTASGVLFRLADKVIVPGQGKINAAVQADQPGAHGNVGPSAFTIPGLSTERQKIVYAESVLPMSGGVRQVAVLTEQDLASAEEDFKKGIGEAFLATLSSDAARAVQVMQVTPKANHKPGDEISDFTLTGTATVMITSYDREQLKSLINQELAQKFDLSSEKVVSLSKDPAVVVGSYNAADGTAELKVNQEVMVTLDPDAEKLATAQFLGKKKSDIERYLLGLSHVTGVDVRFSPSWMRVAPNVPDRIKLMVKTVQ